MKEDILTSHESIVKDTPEEDYQLVMTHYRQNLAEIKTEVPNLNEQEHDLPSYEVVQNGLDELFGGQSSTLFSFDSQQ